LVGVLFWLRLDVMLGLADIAYDIFSHQFEREEQELDQRGNSAYD
jgi:hypothetical protein